MTQTTNFAINSIAQSLFEAATGWNGRMWGDYLSESERELWRMRVRLVLNLEATLTKAGL